MSFSEFCWENDAWYLNALWSGKKPPSETADAAWLCTVFENLPKCLAFRFPNFDGIFHELLSTENVYVARFARNFEWDFFGDFQTLCTNCGRRWSDKHTKIPWNLRKLLVISKRLMKRYLLHCNLYWDSVAQFKLWLKNGGEFLKWAGLRDAETLSS